MKFLLLKMAAVATMCCFANNGPADILKTQKKTVSPVVRLNDKKANIIKPSFDKSDFGKEKEEDLSSEVIQYENVIDITHGPDGVGGGTVTSSGNSNDASGITPTTRTSGIWYNYSDNGHKDNGWEKANTIPTEHVDQDNIEITAKLNTNNWWTCLTQNVGEKDTDWYKFGVRRGGTYLFRFTAPNSSYRYTFYKDRGASDMNTPEELFSYTGTVTKYITLTTGTNYIKVTADKKGDIKSKEDYKIEFYRDILNVEPQADLRPPYTDYYKALIWENDIYPDNLPSRWDGKAYNLRYYYSLSSFGSSGTSGKTGYYDQFFVDEGTYLDSVIYVWDKDLIGLIADSFEKIHILVGEKFNSNQIDPDATMEVRVEASKAVLYDVLGHTKLGDICTIGQDLYDIVMFFVALSNSVLKDYTVQNFYYHFGAFVGGIKATAAAIADPDYIGNDALCIPKYVTVHSHDEKPMYNQYYSYVTWDSNYAEPDYNYRTNFRYKDPSVYVDQVAKINGQVKNYHGTIELFHTSQQLGNYIHVNPQQFVDDYTDYL